MTPEQLAVLADDIADMADDFVRARDAKSLRNMAANLARMIRRHEAGRHIPLTLLNEADKWITDSGHWAKKAHGLPDDGTRCASDLIFDLATALRKLLPK